MGKYGKEYEAFEIFEEIQNQKSREETVPQPLSQGRVRELLSFEEAPYYEIEYGTEPDGGAVPGQGTFSISGSSVRSSAEEGKETGVKALKSAGTGRIKGQQTEPETWKQEAAQQREPETWKWGAGQQTEPETWKRGAGQQTELETWRRGAGQQTELEMWKQGAGQQTEPETWKWGAGQQTETEMWKREAAQQTEAETWKQGAAQHLNPESIRLREEDPVRQMFNQMRDIARESRYLNFRSSHFYNQKMQRENSRLFYRQGMFMKDFRDAYEKVVPYSSYYPNYQMMGYEQLRTFFTWRSAVREGRVEHVSLSYAFLYIYELLNNIGVDSPEEGAEQLVFFWDAFRVYDKSVDKYMSRWLKDYYIYYELNEPSQNFVEKNVPGAYYPGLSEEENLFELYCGRSKYDIKKSAFFTEREDLIRRCFLYTFERLHRAFAEGGFELDDFLFQPARKMAPWTPFEGALFYPAGQQADRQVMLSRKEVYVCRGNQWTFSSAITTDSGKRLMGYCLKQMESVLRKVTKYKHKLTANPDMLSPVMADELKKAGICLETVISDAVTAFYREETKTVVRVNPGVLEKIRQEAYVIQEKLTVPEGGSDSGRRLPVPEEGGTGAGSRLPVPEEGVIGAGRRLPVTEEGVIGAGSRLPVSGEGGTGAGSGLPVPGERDSDSGKTGTGLKTGHAEEGTQLRNDILNLTAEKEIQASSNSDFVEKESAALLKEETVQHTAVSGEGEIQPSTLQKKSELQCTVPSEKGESQHAVLSEKAESQYTAWPDSMEAWNAAHQIGNGMNAASEPGDEWNILKEALTDTERQALRIILNDKADLKQFADEQGIMLEVLAEGINDKASDAVGDGLLDNEFEVYEDYLEDVRRMLDAL